MPDHSFAEKIYDGPEADAALIKPALDQESIQAFVDIGGLIDAPFLRCWKGGATKPEV
jgi:hypothetical protein